MKDKEPKKGVKNFLKKVLTNKKVIKEDPRATIVLKESPKRSAFFHEAMEQEQKNILKWN